jgi:hypothetical protein
MRKDCVTDLTLADVKGLIRTTNQTPLLDACDKFLGATIILGASAAGNPAPLVLLEPKNELVRLGRSMIKRLTRREDDGFLARHRRITAAHHLLVYTAFFAAAEEVLTTLNGSLHLSASERRRLAERAAEQWRLAESSPHEEPADGVVPVAATRLPHPAEGLKAKESELSHLYVALARGLRRFMFGLEPWESAPEDVQARVLSLLEELPQVAVEAYDSQYRELAADIPEFAAWATVDAHDRTAAQLDHLDVGLASLREAVIQQPARRREEEALAVVTGLAARYNSVIAEPIIADPSGPEGDGLELAYPAKQEAFVPQSFRVVRADRSAGPLRLEDERFWGEQAEHQDISGFLLSYLSSPYSVETPLVLLGHPGSGKSLLTEMLAARLATPAFNPIRIELRDIVPERELPLLIEEHIYATTHRRVNWGEFSDQLTDAPPVLILDGFDELLQASGRIHANYLEKVQQFQRDMTVLGRPIRAIVTSRITLIDKAVVPRGSTIVRLLEFDSPRRRQWIEIWNRHNVAYFTESGVRPFELPAHKAIDELGGQPLLLLMLALYDSQDNKLAERGGTLDRTLLYDDLLRRFIGRERSKGATGDDFRTLEPSEREREVDKDMRRLGIAAMSMFNRRTLHISREMLDQEIDYFGLAREVKEGYGRQLSQAELLLGSFFFVHQSRSTDAPDGIGETPTATAFEFLHNTFGEFLSADFILSTVVEEATSVAVMSAAPALQVECERKLREGNLPKDWFISFMYTPLYERPVILEMIREWASHRLARASLEREEFLRGLDALVESQLRRLLAGNAPPTLMTTEAQAPYASLPLLGHYAVYSMNLVLLRVVADASSYHFDEASFSPHEGGTRAWDQLTNLWRSWLSLDNLAGLAAVLSTARNGHDVALSAEARFSGVAVGGRLNVIWSAMQALGDDAATALTGLHLHDAGRYGLVDLTRVHSVLRDEGIDLDLEVSLRIVRERGWMASDLDAAVLSQAAEAAVSLRRTTRSHHDLLRLLCSPNAPSFLCEAASRGLRRPELDDLLMPPTDFTVAHLAFCGALEPRWLEDVVELVAEEPPAMARLASSAPDVLAAVVSFGAAIWPGMKSNALESLFQTASETRSPSLTVAGLLVADRVGAKAWASKLTQALVSYNASTALAVIAPREMRRVIALAERSQPDLVGWMASDVDLTTLPRDVAADLQRLARASGQPLRSSRHDHLLRSRFMLGHPLEVAALMRLAATDPAVLQRDVMRTRRGVLRDSLPRLDLWLPTIEELPISTMPALARIASEIGGPLAAILADLTAPIPRRRRLRGG